MYNIGGLSLFVSAAYKTLFADAYDKAAEAISEQKTVYEKLYDEVPTTDTSVDMSYLSAIPSLRPMRASHPEAGGTEVGGTVRKIPYKAEATLDRDLIESTNGQFLVERMVRGLAQKASQFKMELINDLILANGVCWDTAAFFSAAHPAFEKAGIQSNLAATAFGAGAGYATELPNFMTLLNSAGDTMGIVPDVILVSPTLWPAAMTYFNPNRITFDQSGTATGSWPINPIENLGYVFTTDDNTATATEWFMFSTKFKKPFVIVETEAPVIEATPTDDAEYIVDRRMHIVSSWYGVAEYGPWWTAYQSNV